MFAKFADLPAVLLRTDFRHGGDQVAGGDPVPAGDPKYPLVPASAPARNAPHGRAPSRAESSAVPTANSQTYASCSTSAPQGCGKSEKIPATGERAWYTGFAANGTPKPTRSHHPGNRPDSSASCRNARAGTVSTG